MTLFDEAELSSVFNGQAMYDGLTVSLLGALVGMFVYATEAFQDWKPAMPIHSAWADNYVSLVGLHQREAVNIALQNALDIVGPSLGKIHSYPMDWYDAAIINPRGSTLGFQRSFEYGQVTGPPGSTFPPPEVDFPPGVSYHQAPYASDSLILEPLALPDVFVFQKLGVLPDVVVQGEVRLVQAVGNVAVEIKHAVQQAGALISQGFNYVGNVAAQGSETLVNLFDSAVLRLTLSTSPSQTPTPRLQDASVGSPRKHGPDSPTSSPAMVWLPLQIPTNATGMAFDFIAAGNPLDDVSDSQGFF